MIGAEPHLIAPVEFGPGRLCGPTESRVLLGEPPADGHGILLEGSAPWFLRGEAPALEVAAHRPDGNDEATPLLEEVLDRLPGPEGEGQAELIGTATHDEPDDQGSLVRGQARDRGASPALGLQGLRPA